MTGKEGEGWTEGETGREVERKGGKRERDYVYECYCEHGNLQKSVHAFILSTLAKQGLSCYCCWLHNSKVWTSQLTIGVLCSHTSQPFIWVLGMELRHPCLVRYLSHLLGHLPGSKINFLLATNYLKPIIVLDLGF